MILKKGYIFNYKRPKEPINGENSEVELTKFRVMRQLKGHTDGEGNEYFRILAVPLSLFDGLINEPIELIVKPDEIDLDVGATLESKETLK